MVEERAGLFGPSPDRRYEAVGSSGPGGGCDRLAAKVGRQCCLCHHRGDQDRGAQRRTGVHTRPRHLRLDERDQDGGEESGSGQTHRDQTGEGTCTRQKVRAASQRWRGRGLVAPALFAITASSLLFGTSTLNRLSNVAQTVIWVASAILISFAAVIAAMAFFRAWRGARRTEVVVTTLTDATGDQRCSAAAPGLTFGIREELLEALPSVTNRLTAQVERARTDPTSPIYNLVVGDPGDSVLDELASTQQELSESLASIAPEATRGIVRLSLETLLRQRGLRVNGVMQRVTNAPGRIGISLTVSNLQSEHPPTRITIWEDETAHVAGSQPVERLYALTLPVSRALACELMRQHLIEQEARRRNRRWVGRFVGRHPPATARSTNNKSERRGPVPQGRRRQAGSRPPTSASPVVDFMVGLLYQTAARRYAPGTLSFYRLSAQALRRAEAALDHYMCAYLLGATLAEQARRTSEGEAGELFEKSCQLFEEACDKLKGAGLDDPQPQTEFWKIRGSLVTNWWLLAGVPGPGSDLWRRRADKATSQLQMLGPDTISDSTTLYNLACCFAVAARHIRVETTGGANLAIERHAQICALLKDALRFFAWASLRNEQWWTDGQIDPDLSAINRYIPDARKQISDLGSLLDGDEPAPEAIRPRVDEAIRFVIASQQTELSVQTGGAGSAG